MNSVRQSKHQKGGRRTAAHAQTCRSAAPQSRFRERVFQATIALLLLLSGVVQGTTGAPSCQTNFAEFTEVCEWVSEGVGSPDFHLADVLAHLGASPLLEPLDVVVSSLVVDQNEPLMTIEGSAGSDDIPVTLFISGADSYFNIGVYFESLALDTIVGMVEQHTNNQYPIASETLEGVVLEHVEVTLSLGDVSSLAVLGQTTLRQIETEVLVTVARPSEDQLDLLLSFKQAEVNLSHHFNHLAHTVIDTTLPEIAFTVVQSVSTQPTSVSSGDLGGGAQSFYESFGEELQFSPGVNITSNLPMSVLPSTIRDVLGVHAEDALIVQGSVVLDLNLFLGGGNGSSTVGLSRLTLFVDLPAASPHLLPELPAWLDSPLGVHRSLVIAYDAPEFIIQVIDTIAVQVEGQNNEIMLVSELRTGGNEESFELHGQFLGTWANPWGIRDLTLDDAGFDLHVSGRSSEFTVYTTVELGNKTVNAEISVASGVGSPNVRLMVAVDRLSTAELSSLIESRLSIGSRINEIPIELTLEDATLALQFGSDPLAAISATTTFLDFEADVLLMVFEGQREGGTGRGPEMVASWHPRSSLDLTELIPALAETPIAEELSSFSLNELAVTFSTTEVELDPSVLDPIAIDFFRHIYAQSSGYQVDIPAGVGLLASLPTPEEIEPLMGALWMEPGAPLVLQGSLPSGFLGGSSSSGGSAGGPLAGLNLLVPLPEMRPAKSPEWFVAGQLALELTGAPSFGVVGSITVNIDGDVLTFSQTAQLSRTKIQLIGAMVAEEPWEEPFGIQWLVMNEVAFVLDVDLATASLGVGFLGDMVIGEKDIRGAVYLALNVATGAPTNFVFLGESEEGVGIPDLTTLQAKMASAGADTSNAIPVDQLPQLALTDIGVRFAPRAYPALDVAQGFAVGGQLWLGTPGTADARNLAGVEIDVSFTGIIANGHVDRIELGELSLDDASIDLALTLAEQRFGMAGDADLGFMRTHLLVEASRDGLRFDTEAELFDGFSARLQGHGQPGGGFSIAGTMESSFEGAVAEAINGHLQAIREAAVAGGELAANEAEQLRSGVQAGFDSALHEVREPARSAMVAAESSYRAAVSQRSAAHSAWQAAKAECKRRPWTCGAVPVKRAKYERWKGEAAACNAVWQSAKAVYEADIQTWIAENAALAALQAELQNAASAASAAQATLAELRDQLSEAADAVTVRSAGFVTGLSSLREGAQLSLTFEIEVLGTPQTVTMGWSSSDFSSNISSLAATVFDK